MPCQLHVARLIAAERTEVRDLIAAGVAPARTQTHARILLKCGIGAGGPPGPTSASPRRSRSAPAPWPACASASPPRDWPPPWPARPPRTYRRKLDGAQEARLVAIACTDPTQGRARWSLRLLSRRLVELEVVAGISPETVRVALKKTSSSRG